MQINGFTFILADAFGTMCNIFQCLTVPVELTVILTFGRGIGRGASMVGLCDCVKVCVGFII